MYLPASFTESDPRRLFELIDAYGFATLFSPTDGAPVVSHVPLLVDRAASGAERILGHVARANEHWELFDGAHEALAVFHGPHGYVSPAWYATAPSVPTWNYAVVHVYGRPRTVDPVETEAILRRLIETYEGARTDRWSGELPADYVADQLPAIVGFEMRVDRIEGKFKLGQNRTPADREGAIAGLERSPDHASRELAAFSRRYFERRGGG